MLWNHYTQNPPDSESVSDTRGLAKVVRKVEFSADLRCGLLLIGAYLILRNTISHLGAPLWTHIV